VGLQRRGAGGHEAGGVVTRWELELAGTPQRGLAAGSDLVHRHLGAWLAAAGGRGWSLFDGTEDVDAAL
jgi:hypothetical protein